MAFPQSLVTGFQNWKIAPKLGLLVALTAAPIAYPVYLGFDRGSTAVDFANSEIDGLAVVTALHEVEYPLQQFRTHAYVVANGVAGEKQARDEFGADVDAKLAAFEKAVKANGSNLGLEADIAAFKAGWSETKGRADSLTGAAVLAAFASSIDPSVAALYSKIEDNSGIILDPDISPLHTILTMVDVFPALTNAISTAELHILAAASKGSISDGDRRLLLGQLARAAAASEALDSNMGVANANDARYASRLGPKLEAAQTATKGFIQLAGEAIADENGRVTADFDRLDDLAEATVLTNIALLAEARALVGSDLDARVSSETNTLITQMVVAIGGVIVAAALAFAIVLTITRPMRQLTAVANQLRLGELDVEIPITGTNEVGQLAEALRRMQESLKSAMSARPRSTASSAWTPSRRANSFVTYAACRASLLGPSGVPALLQPPSTWIRGRPPLAKRKRR